MKAAIYQRVSTTDQTTANQTPELQAFADRKAWPVVAQFTDEGVSGAKEFRPGLDALRQAAARKEFDVVLVWKFDRISRNTRHLLSLHEELSKLGVALVSVTEGIDTTTPAGVFTLTVMGGVSQLERANIIERTKAGLARVKAEGRKLGRPVRQVNVTELVALQAKGLTQQQISKITGVPQATVSRRLKAA